VPVAGGANVARLSEILEFAAIAFLIVAAEDEQAAGTVRARENASGRRELPNSVRAAEARPG
jgi:hypothetical protein